MAQTCRKAVNSCKEICTDLKTSAEVALKGVEDRLASGSILGNEKAEGKNSKISFVVPANPLELAPWPVMPSQEMLCKP